MAGCEAEKGEGDEHVEPLSREHCAVENHFTARSRRNMYLAD